MFTVLAPVHVGVRPCQTEAPSSCQTSLTSTLHPSSVSSCFPELSVSLFPSFLPLTPGVQLPPQWPSESLPCQAILLTRRQHPQCSWDAARGKAACFSQPTPSIYLSPISPGPASVLPCSIKTSRYLFSSRVLPSRLTSAIPPSEASTQTWLVFSLGLTAPPLQSPGSCGVCSHLSLKTNPVPDLRTHGWLLAGLESPQPLPLLLGSLIPSQGRLKN